MEKIEYKAYEETVYKTQLKNRLNVYFIHKPGFSKSYVTISAPIGSINQAYKDDKGMTHMVPKGVAHFLEHKVFEKDGEDISKAFSMDEAQINAFTEHNQTTYLFSATNELIRNTQRLINMFFFPDFTDQGVEKEKNIIQEELNMYIDDPLYKQYHTLINNMYHSHPIKDDILGTASSIQSITKKDLKAMHEAYYQPEKANVVIISSANVKSVFEALENNVELPQPTALQPVDTLAEEPENIPKDLDTIILDVKKPSVLIGIKFIPVYDNALQRIKESLALSIFMDLTLGKSSDHYENLLQKGVINDTYGLELAYEKEYAYALIGSESSNPEAAYQALKEILRDIGAITIDPQDFERMKKQLLGNFMMGLDAQESLAHQFTDYIQNDVYFYDVLKIASDITLEEVQAQRHKFNMANISTLIGKPK